MSNAGHLHLDDSRAAEGLRQAEIVTGPEQRTVWIRRADGPLDTSTGADPFLLATLLLWIRQGGDLHVHGSVSRRLLAGLTEWQQAWARWRPDRYRTVQITADEVRDESPASRRAVAAYSGGLDAAYTVRRHLTGSAGWQTVDLCAAMLVQGFDIPPGQEEVFQAALTRARRSLEDTDLRVVPMSTNFRELGQDWEDGHGLAVASCLTSLAPEFGIGLIASGKPYESLVLPWGSNPLTDPWCSSGLLEIRNDGAAASRSDKAALVAQSPAATRGLRVCWQGDQLDRNCGQCEKCQRTLYNFKAVGCEDLGFMPEDAGTQPVRLRTRGEFLEWESLAAYAEAAGRRDVARHARAVLRSSRARNRPGVRVLRRGLSRVRRSLGKTGSSA